ncbi:hypothetical protein BGX21_000468 [Mortierella sp. AD011]|nr:hypothetical protein BGX20_011206 [Mortierella sp. AD010]KAF9401830.1 hypothetical protein BGX21_000468 [Mortierella sp. AD011]
MTTITSTPLLLIKSNQLTLTVNSPTLKNYPPYDTVTLRTITSAIDSSSWTVTIVQHNDVLTVSIRRQHQWSADHPELTVYQSMYIVPRRDQNDFTSAPINIKLSKTDRVIQGTVEVSKVLRNGMHSFDIILSTIPQLPKLPEFPADLPKDYSNMMTLLKDIDTANVCFIVESGNTPSNVLWAHKCILEKIAKLAEIIQAASTTSRNTVETEMEESMVSCPSTLVPAIPVIRVDKFDLTTLCVMLRFIYTGEICLRADTSEYAISTTERWPEQLKYSADRHCPGSLLPWTYRHIDWQDLLPAADYFGISDLRVRCEQAIIGSIDESNVMQILFSFGDRYEDIKEAALKYIVRNMALLIHGNKDPFEPYKSHANCYDILVEVMRRRDKRE